MVVDANFVVVRDSSSTDCYHVGKMTEFLLLSRYSLLESGFN